MKKRQIQSNISDDANASRYYEKHKTRPTCPFCGAEMRFISNYYYEGHDYYWICPECGCMLPDLAAFSEEVRKALRIKLRQEYKEAIADREKGISYYRAKLKLWGKYMSDKEKVKLLAEVLEEGATNTN